MCSVFHFKQSDFRACNAIAGPAQPLWDRLRSTSAADRVLPKLLGPAIGPSLPPRRARASSISFPTSFAADEALPPGMQVQAALLCML